MQMFLRTEKIMQMFPMNNGLFEHIDYLFPEVLHITNQELDLVFLTSWGLRLCAPVVHVVHQDTTVSQLTDSELTTLASLILNMYKWKWDKLSELLTLQYDPIHNYMDDFTETISENIEASKTRTPDLLYSDDTTVSSDKTDTESGSRRTVNSGQHSNTRTDNLSEEITAHGSNDLYGFNSEEAVGADLDASHTLRENTGTVGDAGTDSSESTLHGGIVHTIDDSQTITGEKRTTGTDTEESGSERSRTREFTHSGNIGNLTTQQLINQEIELWRWTLIQQVLNDVKDFLTLPVYD